MVFRPSMSPSRSAKGSPASSRRAIAASKARVFGSPVRKSRSARTRSRSTSSRSLEANQPRRPPIVAYVRKRSGVESVSSSEGEMFGLMMTPSVKSATAIAPAKTPRATPPVSASAATGR
jgi:hypothetical protein